MNCQPPKRGNREIEKIAELEERGYRESVNKCEHCGTYYMYKYKKNPSSWESDVNIYTITYKCPYCNNSEVFTDSD